MASLTSKDMEEDVMVQLKKLSRINGEVNRMTDDELNENLTKLNLDTRGSKDVRKKRIKDFYRRQKAVSKLPKSVTSYDYLCVIDFEATCTEKNPEDYPHEIIEFPAVLLCVHNFTVVSEFHQYCRPVINPILSDFCKKLTGITQEIVQSADTFSTVLENFLLWLNDKNLGTKYRFAIVTDGPWDMERFLKRQCEMSSVAFPKFAKKWINIRKIYSNFYNCRRLPLNQMLEELGMAFIGRQHCGLDDARNITRIVVQLLKDGANLKINEWIVSDNSKQAKFSKSTNSNKSADMGEWKKPNGKHTSQLKSVTIPDFTDGDLGADPQVSVEDLKDLVSYRTLKKGS
ncbi:3'-5' exoribonuclease 1 [Chamberlinius hualienensis]